MSASEVFVPSMGLDLAATWSYEEDQVAGLVLLHPSDDGARRQFVLEDLATRLPRHGVSDFDPGQVISQLTCPVLVMYGEDEWVPVADSIDIWRQRLPDPRLLTVHRLPQAGHHPALNGGRAIEAIDPEYTRALDSWLRDRLSNTPPN